MNLSIVKFALDFAQKQKFVLSQQIFTLCVVAIGLITIEVTSGVIRKILNFKAQNVKYVPAILVSRPVFIVKQLIIM